VEPVVPSVERARWLVWAGLAALLLLRAGAPGAAPKLGWVDGSDGCRLAPASRARPCPCSELPAEARRVLGLPIALNRASAPDLERVPGIGPVRARAITEDRRARGPFASVAALDRVAGIGPRTARALGPHLFVLEPDPACARPGG
jgi:competence protein ComEA